VVLRPTSLLAGKGLGSVTRSLTATSWSSYSPLRAAPATGRWRVVVPRIGKLPGAIRSLDYAYARPDVDASADAAAPIADRAPGWEEAGMGRRRVDR